MRRLPKGILIGKGVGDNYMDIAKSIEKGLDRSYTRNGRRASAWSSNPKLSSASV
jgi:hypothetical protein